jgi:hypothetical protein
VTGVSTGTTTVTASAAASNIAPTTASITVAPATPTSITISSGGTQSAAVGTAFGTALAVTVKDQNGAVIPNSPVVFTAVPGGSGQSGTFSNSTGTITVNTNASGVATAGTFTANGKIGAYTVTVTAGPAPAATFNLTNTPGAASKFSVSAPANATSGAAFAITVTAQDSFGNTATGYAGTVKITSSDAQATLPANAGLTSGVGTFNVTLKNGGNQTVTATDTVTSSITGVSGAIAVAGPLPATHFSISAPSTVTQGASFNITVTALDTNNATASTYAGTVHFSSSDGVATLPANATLTNGVGTFPVTLNTTTSTQTITATDTVTASITGSTGAITVAAGANHLVVAAPASAKAGVSFQFTVTAQNAQNTTVPSYTGTVHFTSTDSAATLPADAVLSNGVGTFNATLKTLGNFTITATDTVTGSITGVSAAINVGPGNAAKFAISAPATSKIGVPFNVTVTAQDSFNNTATGYAGTVHFTSSDVSAILPANATLTAGVGTFPVTLNTISPPTQTITVADTVTGSIQGTSAPITVGPATSVIALAGTPQTTQVNQDFPTQFKVIVQDGNGNPVSGAFVTFTAPSGSGGPSGTFAGSATVSKVTDSTGQTTAPTFTANGTKGSYIVTATVNNATSAIFNLTNINMVLVGSATVGQNLQSSILVTLPQSSASPSTITLTSSDPTKVLIYNGTNTPPGASTSILINAGDTQGIAYVEGQAGGTGSVTVTATLAGYDNGTSTVTVTNSGFVLSQQSGNGIGASFTAGLGIPVNLVVNSAQLDANGNFVQTQAVRTNFTSTPDGNGGVIITLIPVTVPLQSTNTTVGTITSPVTFNGGDDTQLAAFSALSPGATTVSLQSAGNGFTATPMIGCPSSCMPANQVFITVPNQMISLANVSVGQNLEAAATVTLNTPAPGNTNDPLAGVHITLTTSDPHLQFSATAGGTGSSSLVVLAHAGQLQSATFYIYGLTSSGSAQYTATADSGFAPPQVPGTVTFTPSAFVISGPSQQPGTGIITTNMAPPSPVYLYSVQLNSSGGILAFQPIAGALNVPITLQINAGSPGSIASPVAFAAGTGVAQTTFTPTAGQNGLGSLTVGEPAGFTAPTNTLQTITVTVNVPGIAVQSATVGQNLQVQGSFSLGQFAPTGGVNVTLTAQTGILLSSSPTTMGSTTLVVNVPAGGFNGIFYVQALAVAPASLTYTASAPGYRAPLSPATVTIVASAPYVGGPNAFQQGSGNPSPVTHGTTQALTLYMALVDGSGNATDHQALAGGTTLNVTVLNSNTAAGTVTPGNPVTITGGTDGVALTFNAASGGAGQSTSISAASGALPPVKLNVI